MILDTPIDTTAINKFSNFEFQCHQLETRLNGAMHSRHDSSGHESDDTCHTSKHDPPTNLKLARVTAKNKRKNFVPRPIPKFHPPHWLPNLSTPNTSIPPDTEYLETPGLITEPPSNANGIEAPLDLSVKKMPALKLAPSQTPEYDNVLRNHLKSPLTYNPAKRLGSKASKAEGHLNYYQPRICDSYPLYPKVHRVTPSITDNVTHGEQLNTMHKSWRDGEERNMILPELLLTGTRKTIKHEGDDQRNHYTRNSIQYPISNYHAKKNNKLPFYESSTIPSKSDSLSYDCPLTQNHSLPLSTYKNTSLPPNEVDVKNDFLIRRILKDVSSLSNARADEMKKKQMLLLQQQQRKFNVSTTKTTHKLDTYSNGAMFPKDKRESPQLNRDFRLNYMYKCNQSLNCPSLDSTQKIGVSQHYHCHGDLEKCPLPLYSIEDIKDHCKFHEQEDSNLDSSFKFHPIKQPCEGPDCPYERREAHFHCVWASCCEVFAMTEHLARRQHYRMHQHATWSQMSDDPIHTTANFQATNLFQAGKRKRGRPPKNRILDTPLQNTIAYAFESGSLCPLKEGDTREGVTLDTYSRPSKKEFGDIRDNRFDQNEVVHKPFGAEGCKPTPPQYKFGEFDFNLKEIHRNPYTLAQFKSNVQGVVHDDTLPQYPKDANDNNEMILNSNNHQLKVKVKPGLNYNCSQTSTQPSVTSYAVSNKISTDSPCPPYKFLSDLPAFQENGAIYSEFIISNETSFIQTGLYNPATTSKGSCPPLHKPSEPQEPSSSLLSCGQVASTNRVTYNMEKMAAKRKNSKNQAYKNLCITFMPYKRAPKTRKKVASTNPDAS